MNRCNENEAAREEPSVAYLLLLPAGTSAADLAFCGFRARGGLGGLGFGHDKGLGGTAAAATAATAAVRCRHCGHLRKKHGLDEVWMDTTAARCSSPAVSSVTSDSKCKSRQNEQQQKKHPGRVHILRMVSSFEQQGHSLVVADGAVGRARGRTSHTESKGSDLDAVFYRLIRRHWRCECGYERRLTEIGVKIHASGVLIGNERTERRSTATMRAIVQPLTCARNCLTE